jgi:hypothetical protein
MKPPQYKKIRRKNGNNWEKKNEDRSENENEMGSMRTGGIRRESVRRKRMRGGGRGKELEEVEDMKVEDKQKVRNVEVSL